MEPHGQADATPAKRLWVSFSSRLRRAKQTKALSRQRQIFVQRRRQGLARVWAIFGKRLQSNIRSKSIEDAARECAERRLNRRINPRKHETPRQSRWRKWLSMRTGLVYPHRRKILLRSSRRIKQWKRWFTLVRGVNISRWLREWVELLSEKKELAYEVAVDYVNDLISDRGLHITDLSEIDGVRGRPVPLAESEDQVVALFVNQLLRDCRIPCEEEEEEEEEQVGFGQSEMEEVMEGIDMRPALASFTVPDVRHLRSMTEKDITLYVNDRTVYRIIDDIFMGTEMPICLNTFPDELMLKAVEGDVFDDVHEFSGVDLEKLLNMEPNDPNKYAVAPVLDDVCARLYMDIELPIVPNDVDDEAVQMIADETLLGPMGDLFGPVDFGHLRDYEEKDMQLYVNERVIDMVIMQQHEQIELPIESNTPSEETIQEIVEKDYGEWIPPFSNLELDPLLRCSLSISFDKRVVDDLVASFALDELNDLPVEANEASAETIAEIADFEDYMNVFGELPELDEKPLKRYKIKDVRVHTSADFIEGVIDKLLANEQLPLTRNTPTKQMLEDILSADDFTDVIPPISKLQCDCLSVPPNDILRYVNDREIDKVIDGVLTHIHLPITRNTFDNAAIDEMLSFDLMCSMDTVLEVDQSSLERYQFKDVNFYVNNKVADAITYSFLAEVTLPIGPNQVTDDQLEAILRGDDYSDVIDLFDDVDISRLQNIDPLERRINFIFPVSAEAYLGDLLQHLPIGPNVCTNRTVQEITSIYDNIDFFDFALDATRPIQEYHAPPEVFENIDDVVERLLNRILRRDILPNMPFKREIIIEDNTLASITANLLRERATLTQLTPSPVMRLAALPPNEIPSVVLPEDVVQQLLWCDILPRMPLTHAAQRMAKFNANMDDSTF